MPFMGFVQPSMTMATGDRMVLIDRLRPIDRCESGSSQQHRMFLATLLS